MKSPSLKHVCYCLLKFFIVLPNKCIFTPQAKDIRGKNEHKKWMFHKMLFVWYWLSILLLLIDELKWNGMLFGVKNQSSSWNLSTQFRSLLLHIFQETQWQLLFLSFVYTLSIACHYYCGFVILAFGLISIHFSILIYFSLYFWSRIDDDNNGK